MVLLSSFLAIVCLQITNGFPVNIEVSLKLNVKKHIKDPVICKTAICNETARELLRYMDLEADPCTDFYQFTCGNFLKNEIPIGQDEIGPSADTKIYLMQKLISILENPLIETKFNFERQTKMAFQSCINRTAIDSGGVKDLKNVLQTYGGWPLIEGDKWNEENINLTMILTKLQLYNIWGIYRLLIINYQNRAIPVIFKHVITLSPASYGDNSSKLVQIYKEYILNMSLIIGERDADDNFIKSVEGIFDFERSLAECYNAQPSDEADVGGILTLETIKNIFGKTLDIESIFKSLYESAGIDLKPNEPIISNDILYLKCVSKLLDKTPKRNVANYLIWSMIQQSSAALPQRLRDLSDKFKKELGYPSETNYEKYCADILDGYLAQSTGYLYVRSHLTRTSKNNLMHLIEQLKSAFKKIILKENWTTEKLRNTAISKLEEMVSYVGYPDFFEDPKILDVEFTGVDFSSYSSFLEMLYALKMMKINRQLRSMRNNSDVIPMSILIDNAQYMEDSNKIAIYAGILLSTFYADSNQMYMNFGGIGVAMGHEIGHAFDSIEKQFHKNGQTNEMWQEKDKENFQNRALCLVNQYKKIEPENKYLSIEIIADNIGVRVSYAAYKNWLKRLGAEEQLPGLPYTPIQMFFIAYGRMYCIKVRDENHFKESSHPANYLRAIIPLKNMKAFSNAFKCKAGSEMNPSEKCRVW